MIAELLIIAAFTIIVPAGIYLGERFLRAYWRSKDRPPAAVLNPPRPLTIQERIAALEPEIKQGKEAV